MSRREAMRVQPSPPRQLTRAHKISLGEAERFVRLLGDAVALLRRG